MISSYGSPPTGARVAKDGGSETEEDDQHADKRRPSRSERVRYLVQLFEETRAGGCEAAQPRLVAPNSPSFCRRRESAKLGLVAEIKTRPQPPSTLPKSSRVKKWINLQLSLNKPTQISSLFQDEHFLEKYFFCNLRPIDRCAAAQVCRLWRDILYANKTYWQNLVAVIDCTHLRREQLLECILRTLQTTRLKQRHYQQHHYPNQHHLDGNSNHDLYQSNSSNQHRNNQRAPVGYAGVLEGVGQLDDDEIWRIQELCIRFTSRATLNDNLVSLQQLQLSGQSPPLAPQAISANSGSGSQEQSCDATTSSLATSASGTAIASAAAATAVAFTNGAPNGAASAPQTASTSGIVNSKSNSSQISASTLSSNSLSSLLSPLSESGRVEWIKERLYGALDTRGFDAVRLFGAADDDIEELAARTSPDRAHQQLLVGRLCNSAISDRGLELFTRTFAQLEELELTGCNDISNDISLQPLTRLRRLIITDCVNIGDGFAQRLVEIFIQLEVLVLQAYLLTDSFIECVSSSGQGQQRNLKGPLLQVQGEQRLKRLELSYCKELTNGSALLIAKHFQQLRSLSISGSAKINDDGIEIIAEHMKALTSLDLGWLKIGDFALECLACDSRQLEELVLDRNAQITDVGLSYLASLDKLRLLHVRWCPQLTDKSIEAIASMRSLRRLSLAGLHQITAGGILSLLRARQLEELELTNCPAATSDLEQFLAAKMPSCTVIY